MRLIKRIFLCALAAGMVALASDQLHAGLVIDNTLYIPLNIKLSVSFTNKNGVVKQARITSKEILKFLGDSENNKLAIAVGNGNADIVVVRSNSVLNLSRQFPWMANFNELLNASSEGKNGQFMYKSSGLLSLKFYSNPQNVYLGGPAIPPIINPVPDPALSEAASDYWFEIKGVYSYSEKSSAINVGKQKITANFKVEALSGAGYDIESDAPNPTTVTGRASASGGGQILIETDN